MGSKYPDYLFAGPSQYSYDEQEFKHPPLSDMGIEEQVFQNFMTI